MPLLDECPYVVQVLFWLAVFSFGGWGLGLMFEKARRARVRVHRDRRPREVELRR